MRNRHDSSAELIPRAVLIHEVRALRRLAGAKWSTGEKASPARVAHLRRVLSNLEHAGVASQLGEVSPTPRGRLTKATRGAFAVVVEFYPPEVDVQGALRE